MQKPRITMVVGTFTVNSDKEKLNNTLKRVKNTSTLDWKL
jgi:hypothetical protein